MQKDNENTNQNNHPDRSGEVKRARSSAWVALTILSVIAVSAISANTDRDQRGFYDRWSLAWSSISLGLGFIASVLHFAHNLGTGGSSVEDKFVSTYMETALSLTVALAWILSLPVITAPDHDLAMRDFMIEDANLYFSSWGAFILAIYVAVSVAKEKNFQAAKDYYFKRWVWFLISSIVAMSAASRMFKKSPCTSSDASDYCEDLRIGIALSTISLAITLLMAAATFRMTVTTSLKEGPIHMLGMFVACFLLILWAICVGFLTFSNGPGSEVGNLFFSTWISFVLAIDLTVLHGARFVEKATNNNDEPTERSGA